MLNYSKLTTGLRENLLAVLIGSCSRDKLNMLIAACHALARSFLASKSSAGTLCGATGLSTSDLAYDCIAELFQQDVSGRYLQLEAYFGGIPLATVRDDELLAHTRRLVFSKVNQGIFRLCAETDPSMAKILRNIKIAVGSLKSFAEIERFGEPCLAPALCDTLQEYPMYSLDELKTQFIPQTTSREYIPDLLAKLSLFLQERNDRCRIVPVVSVGHLFRAVYTSRHIEYTDIIEAQDHSMEKDVSEIISTACMEISKKTSKKYVGSRKVSDEVFQKYFDVIERELLEKYIGENGDNHSFYEGLKTYIPTLEKQEYLSTHRNRLEYLYKLSEKESLKRLIKL